MRAEATLSADQIALRHSEPKGDLLVPVAVTDDTGAAPIECEMRWAWITKRPTAA